MIEAINKYNHGFEVLRTGLVDLRGNKVGDSMVVRHLNEEEQSTVFYGKVGVGKSVIMSQEIQLLSEIYPKFGRMLSPLILPYDDLVYNTEVHLRLKRQLWKEHEKAFFDQQASSLAEDLMVKAASKRDWWDVFMDLVTGRSEAVLDKLGKLTGVKCTVYAIAADPRIEQKVLLARQLVRRDPSKIGPVLKILNLVTDLTEAEALQRMFKKMGGPGAIRVINGGVDEEEQEWVKKGWINPDQIELPGITGLDQEQEYRLRREVAYLSRRLEIAGLDGSSQVIINTLLNRKIHLYQNAINSSSIVKS